MSKHTTLSSDPMDKNQVSFEDMLWESYEVLSCLAALIQQDPKADTTITLNNDARNGLGRILRHCERLAIDAIGHAPSKKQGASHE